MTNAFVKTPIGHLKSKDNSCHVGSVTDGEIKVEVRTSSDYNQIEKGKYVKICGRVAQFLQNPPYIMFDSKDDYQEEEIESTQQISFEKIISAYQYPKV